MTQNDLIVNHIPLVYSIANKLNVSDQRDDLVGVGMVALVVAADKYGSSYGVAFSAYAKRWIRKAMIKYLKRNSNGDVHLDDHMYNIGSDGQVDMVLLKNDLGYYLHPVEEWVVLKKYFEKARMEDIAEELGFALSRVSQIHSNAINKLRKAFRPTEDEPQEESDGRDDRSALLQVVQKMMWDEWGVEVEL